MENLKEALDKVGESVVTELKKLAKRDEFYASGEMDKSFSYEVKGNIVEVSGLRYTEAISGGINNKKRPNIGRIKKWAKIKGIQPERNGKLLARTDANMLGLALAIAKTIEKEGISKRFGYKGSGFLEELKKNVVTNISEMIAEAYKLDIIVKLKEI